MKMTKLNRYKYSND